MVDYEIWHDEYKGDDSVNEYWHGVYFIPVESKGYIIDYLKKIRDEHDIPYKNKVKFSQSLNKEKMSRFLFNHLQVFTQSLIVKKSECEIQLFNRDNRKIYEKDFTSFHCLDRILGCKYILFKIPDNHQGMDSYPLSYSQRVETTFRFALKSGLNFLFGDKNINIKGFHFDGHDHHNGNIDIKRITKGDFRDHVTFDPNLFVDDSAHNNRKEDEKLIMCLVDYIVGGLSAKLNEKTDEYNALFPLKNMFDRLISRIINKNKNGRWYKAISMSYMEVVGGDFVFKDIFDSPDQLSLF